MSAEISVKIYVYIYFSNFGNVTVGSHKFFPSSPILGSARLPAFFQQPLTVHMLNIFRRYYWTKISTCTLFTYFVTGFGQFFELFSDRDYFFFNSHCNRNEHNNYLWKLIKSNLSNNLKRNRWLFSRIFHFSSFCFFGWLFSKNKCSSAR